MYNRVKAYEGMPREACEDCEVQWNLSIKGTLNKGHLSSEDTVCRPNHIELCTNLHQN